MILNAYKGPPRCMGTAADPHMLRFMTPVCLAQ